MQKAVPFLLIVLAFFAVAVSSMRNAVARVPPVDPMVIEGEATEAEVSADRMPKLAQAITGPALEASRILPADSIARPIQQLDLITVSCADSATAITGDWFRSIECWNASTSPVYLGPTDELTTTNGRPICTDATACPSSSWSADMVGPNVSLGCIFGTADSSQAIYCLSGR